MWDWDRAKGVCWLMVHQAIRLNEIQTKIVTVTARFLSMAADKPCEIEALIILEPKGIESLIET